MSFSKSLAAKCRPKGASALAAVRPDRPRRSGLRAAGGDRRGVPWRYDRREKATWIVTTNLFQVIADRVAVCRAVKVNIRKAIVKLGKGFRRGPLPH